MTANFRSWRSYWNFEQSVRRNARYVYNAETQEFLDAVVASGVSRKVTVKKGTIFWRAQLGHGWRNEMQGDEKFEVECAYPPDRMRPLRDRASDGRANSKGIPCLYLGTTKETAMLEVRPWIGSPISLAQFKTGKPLEIIDCSRNHKGFHIYFEEPGPEEIEKAVWAHIDNAFSEPVTRNDDVADYAPTQIIAESFKQQGLDGLAYRSNFGENGYNVTLFDLDTANLINCSLYRVDKIDMNFSEQDNTYLVS